MELLNTLGAISSRFYERKRGWGRGGWGWVAMVRSFSPRQLT